MNMQDEIKKLLKSNVTLAQKIENLMTKIEINGDNERDMLLAGFSRNVMSHFISINLLMERRLYNSAYALERIFFENILKLKYMYFVMNDEKIKKIYTANNWDKHFPSVAEMAKAIDKEHDIEFYFGIKERAYKAMNDYTHTGPNQIARNFSASEAALDSSFEDELIIDTLEGNRALLKTTMAAFVGNVGFTNGFISEEEMNAYLEY